MPRLLHSLKDSCAANVETAASWPTILVEFPDSFQIFGFFLFLYSHVSRLREGTLKGPPPFCAGPGTLSFDPVAKERSPCDHAVEALHARQQVSGT
jgi:hypothetical protein